MTGPHDIDLGRLKDPEISRLMAAPESLLEEDATLAGLPGLDLDWCLAAGLLAGLLPIPVPRDQEEVSRWENRALQPGNRRASKKRHRNRPHKGTHERATSRPVRILHGTKTPRASGFTKRRRTEAVQWLIDHSLSLEPSQGMADAR